MAVVLSLQPAVIAVVTSRARPGWACHTAAAYIGVPQGSDRGLAITRGVMKTCAYQTAHTEGLNNHAPVTGDAQLRDCPTGCTIATMHSTVLYCSVQA
jgi:hypothetical protein